MASTSRIPVSARISASSSMPAITTTSASPSRSLTHHLAAQDTVNKMADSDSDDHAWGKIERLRIRRIYSEGSSDFAGSSHPSSGTSTDNSPFLGAVTVKLAQERRKTYKSTHDVTGPNTDTATARAGHEDVARPGVATNRISSERPTQIAIPPRDPKNDIAIGPSSPNQRHQTIKNPPVSTRITSLSLMPPLHHSGLNRSSPVDSNHLESVYSKGETESKSQTQKEFANVRPKLVSTLSQGERDMHALGFRAVTNTDAIPGHMAADTRWQGVDAANNRKASVATVDTVSSTGADGGVPNRLRHLLGTESDREFAKTRAKGNISPDEFDVRAAPRRKAIDIPTFLPSSHDMVTFAPINTPARTAAYVDEVASNPPNLPIMLDTDPSESDNSLHAPATTVTTAEKRHQPNLRLSPMPNAPVLLGPPFRHSSRSPVPGVSPPIPAKNPLRQRSSFGGGASGSRASTPGLSGIPSPNSLYATPSDTPGPGILDSAMFLPSRQSQQPTMVAASPEPKPSAQTPTIANKNRENSGRSPKRPEKPPNAKDRRMHCDKAPTTAEIMKAIEFAEGPLQKQRSNTSNISTNAPSKRLPDTPIDESPAMSTCSAGVSRLEDTREIFPNPASTLRPHIHKSASSDNVIPKPSKSPSCPSLQVSVEAPHRREMSAKVKNLTIDVAHATSSYEQSSLTPPSRPNTLHVRSQSNPASPAPASPGLGGSSSTAPTRMSKRAHLIHEICVTERLYAHDLALVRDAFLYRLRPTSHHSTSSTGATKTGGLSPDSRHSAFTFETAGTNATSLESALHASNEDDVKATSSTALPQRNPPALRMSSSTSGNQDLTSAVNETENSVISPNERRKVANIMSAADIKTIFLNLEQLAAFSDDLATSFENAVGDGSGQEPIITENASTDEIIVDRLGAVFQAAMPQIRSLYTFYCSRQAQANLRLSELMSDAAQAARLRECWETIQPFTHSWDLASMLIKPVQRIMKYPMLFNELLAVSTPAHPDYFSLKQAASNASAVADEINEVKRRKDFVEQAIFNGNGKKPLTISPIATSNTISKEHKLSFKLAKRFGKNKEKEKEKTSPVVGSLSHLNIPPSTDAELRSLIKQLEANDMCIIRIGEEVERFPELVRQYWFTQLNIATAWHGTYTLDSSDMIDRRMQVYRNMMELILKYPYVNLNKDIKYKVMPIMNILLGISRNPKAVVTRLASNKADYVKVLSARHRNDLKNIDKETMQNAEEYTSLHAQLLEELPPFLEGVDKLMTILLGAFSIAQKDYYNGMQAHIRKFFFTVKLPIWGSDDTGQAKRPEAGPDSVPAGETIIRLWLDAWKPEQEALESLKLISGSRNRPLSTRTQSREFMNNLSETSLRNLIPRSATPQSSSLARTMSRTVLQPQLSRESSVSSNLSRANRTRSSSLLGSTVYADSPQDSGSGSSMTHIVRPRAKHSRAQSTSSIHRSVSAAFSGRGQLEKNVPSLTTPGLLDSDMAESSVHGRRRAEMNRARTLSYLPPLSRTETIRLPNMQENSVPPPPQYKSRDGKINAVIPAVTSWSNTRPLYQCICVAEFQIFGRIHYSGLPFLTLAEGDIIDILYEVGRVDEFADIPIDVGVADDGLLVARDMRKQIGLILCSFLEPLTRT